jgi:hypothetical protein
VRVVLSLGADLVSGGELSVGLSIVSNRELRQRRWLKRVETLVPRMINKVVQQGGILVANLG